MASPHEGPPAHTHTSSFKQETATETFSFRTVPVWLKENDPRKVKVNAMLDGGSNETFINEGSRSFCNRGEIPHSYT